jgi:hypothetical protein
MAQSLPAPSNQLRKEAYCLWPAARSVADELPERAKIYLKQAINARSAPDGCAMLCGSAVDAILKDKGFEKGSVYSRIDEASKTGLLTPEMAEWAHEVRLDSNRPRHADDADAHVTRQQAENAIEYVRTLGHILYVLPQRVTEGKAAASPTT